MTDDIRLVYIGSAHKALTYAWGHLPAPQVQPNQIMVVQNPDDLARLSGRSLPFWCHIGVELHVTSSSARPALSDAHSLFNGVLARREPPPRKAGV